MPDQAPDIEPSKGKLVYDKERRTIVATETEASRLSDHSQHDHPLEPIIRRPWDRDRACIAAATASHQFRQWVPQRWMELFMDAYEAMEPPPKGAHGLAQDGEKSASLGTEQGTPSAAIAMADRLTLDWYSHREDNCARIRDAAAMLRSLASELTIQTNAAKIFRGWVIDKDRHISELGSQIGRMYRVCNERDVLRNALWHIENHELRDHEDYESIKEIARRASTQPAFGTEEDDDGKNP